ncbi:hypothetical protein [Paraburkholderia sp. DGU8]|uniref:hypothetical protein n=1 Tax=Paraburkholderia sp. DGU8 TaxID=3161997 RepID=UPI00346509F5
MDERFDRRELLLHLGDMLYALSCLATTNEPGALVTHLAQANELQNFEFLRALSPQMTVAAFTRSVASAFALWPRELLEAELNRDALAVAVQHELFDGNPAGWHTYVRYMQTKVTWFGKGLSNIQEQSVVRASPDAQDPAPPADAPLLAKPAAAEDAVVRNERKGWPWPEPGSTS